jgi:hypothetical protein
MANSPEFSKKPGGPFKPQEVNAKPRIAHVRAKENEILKLARQKIARKKINLC